MTAEVVLLGLVGGLIVCVLRDALPIFIIVTERAEQLQDQVIPPHQKAVGLASLVWSALRCWAKGGLPAEQLPKGFIGIGMPPRTRLLPRTVVFMLGAVLVMAVHHLPWSSPAPLLAATASLSLLLIALTSFDWRLVPDSAVIVLALSGIAKAVLAGGDVPQAAFAGAMTGFGVAWGIRAVAGLIRWEPFGYAIPKLSLAIGVWLGAGGIALAFIVAAAMAFVLWIAQTTRLASPEETLPVGGFLSFAGVGALLLGGV